MDAEAPAYNLWALLVTKFAGFALFALSFVRQRMARDWHFLGVRNDLLPFGDGRPKQRGHSGF